MLQIVTLDYVGSTPIGHLIIKKGEQMEFEQDHTVWEFAVDGKTLHLFATENDLKVFSEAIETTNAIRLLAPNARIYRGPMSVMRQVEE